jgi:hypothetical protein
MAVQFKRSIEVGIPGHKGEEKSFISLYQEQKRKKMHNIKVAIPYN